MDAEAQVQESEEKAGMPPIPRIDYHVVRLVRGEFREVLDDKIPAVRVGLEITEGIKGAVGRIAYDDLFIGWGETSALEGSPTERRPATEEEIAQRRTRVIASLK